MVECATYADLIKKTGGGYQSKWHYKDIPILPVGKTTADYPEFKKPAHDAQEALEVLTALFKDDPDEFDKSQYVY